MWTDDAIKGLRPPKREPDPAGVTIPWWLPAQLKALSWLATIGVFYMLWLFSLGAAKDAAAALHITHAGTWTGDVLFWFPVVAGYLLIAFVVAWTGKVAVPAFVSLRWQGDELWPKIWMLVIMLAVSAVIIAGSITVQTETRFEGNRDTAVAGEQVQRGRAALDAQKTAAEAELKTMMESRQGYLAQAASVGAAEWERTYIAQARTTNDSRLPQIERALGAARRADELRAEVRRLTSEIALAPTDASVAQRVTVGEADQAMGGFVDWLGSIRSIMLAILQDIACLLLPWIAMRTEQARARQLAVYGRARSDDDLPLGIPDLRDQPQQQPQPMDGPETVAREEMYDDEGNVLVKVQPAKAHWRKKPRGKKVVVTDNEPMTAVDEAPVLMPSDDRVARDTSADVPLADNAGVMVPAEPEAAPAPRVAILRNDAFEGVSDEDAAAALQAYDSGKDLADALADLGYTVEDRRAQIAAE